MKMRKILKYSLCLVLALTMLVSAFTGCSNQGKPLLTLDGQSISVNLFKLYLSRMKGILCSTAYFGETAKSDDFWETWIDIYDKETYNTHYTEMVLDNSKTTLAVMKAFEDRGLTLPQSYIDEIDAEINEMIINEANGSKTAFNAILANFGANYDVLREAYIIEAKTAYLREDLFGVNGSKVGANIVDEYYKDNYVRFKQIFLYTYEFVYDEDSNGDMIYYRNDNASKISYDTTKTAKVRDDGSFVTDKNGDTIYVYTDSDGKERIAYKKENASTKQRFDSSGEPIIRYYQANSPEMKIVNSDADAIMGEAKVGDYSGFDELVKEYNQEDGSKDYPNGYYVSMNTSYEAVEVIDAVFDMQVGEVRKVQSDYGIHIVMRYELEDKAYTFEENEDLFISTKTGTYVFMSDLCDELLYEYVKEYKDQITVDEELLKTADIKSANPNYYY